MTTVLITAGPTREYLDPVRYLSNDSSGRMGFALAAAAAELGCTTTLIAGPVALETPKGVERIDVVSAREMFETVKRRAPQQDLIIMAAAVADYRPARFSKQKLKRTIGPSDHRTIGLKPNPDILAWLGKHRRTDQTLVGFALETKDLEKNARKKLKHKRCDWIVANRENSIGSAESTALLIPKEGQKVRLPKLLKHDLAMLLLSHLLG